MQKGYVRISWPSIHSFITLLVLLLFWGSVQADLRVNSATLTPDPVVLGQVPSYVLEVENLDTTIDASEFIEITVYVDGVDRSDEFQTTDCSPDGIFFCGQLISGGIATYQFTWNNATPAGEYNVEFDVVCTSNSCVGARPSIPTSVVPESVSPTLISDSAAPGASVTQTITIANSLATDISVVSPYASVSPASTAAGVVSVTYTLTVPDTALANEVLNDTITITDSQGPVASIPVSVTVAADTLSATDISIVAVAGTTATSTFTVSNALATTSITTDPNVDSSVNPTTLPVGGGSVEYALNVPASALDNEVITDTITITDSANNVASISVTVSVSNDFADLPGLTDSERSVAHALDEACAALSNTEVILPPEEVAAKTPTENLLDICNALDTASIENQVDAIKQITPKQAPAQGTSSVEISQRQFDNITARMNALRSGATGFSVSDLSVDFQGVSLPIKLLSQSYGLQSGGSAGEENSALFGKLGFFINGNLSFGDKDGSSNELGFDFDTRGVTAGLDYRLTDQFILGGALGYVGGDTDFDASRGSMDVDGYTLALYTTYYHSNSTYLDAIISYGWNSFDSSRNIDFLSFSEQATGDTDGTELSLSLGGGYDFNRNGLSFGPYGRINYINADIDGYNERSTSGLELVYDNQEVESLTTLIGGQISYAISTSRGVFSPQLRLEWAHEFKNDSRFIDAYFLYDPTQTKFSIATDDPDKNYFNLGTGVSATFGAGKSGYIYYETMIGQQAIRQHSLAAGFRLEF